MRTENDRIIDLTIGELKELIASVIEAREKPSILKGYAELATYLRCSVRTAKRMVEDGRIPNSAIVSRTENGLIRFNINVIEQWKQNKLI